MSVRSRCCWVMLAGCVVDAAFACTLHPNAGPHESVKSLAPLWAGPAHSGTWATPGRPGEGIVLQVLDDGSAVAAWFTHAPAGSTASQAWIAAQGVVDGDTIRFDGAYTARGPRFGTAFDPAQVQRMPWGRFDMRFDDCVRARLSYAGPAEWGSGTRTLERLTAIDELGCSAKRALTAHGARSSAGLRQRSAAWFDPAQDGAGWLVEELGGGRAAIYWFTYDERGEQAWWLGVGDYVDDRIVVTDVVRPNGTRFGDGYDAANVRNEPWGRVDMRFEGCDRAQLDYAAGAPAFGSGVLRPQRLNRLAGSACVTAASADAPAGTWSTGATMPQPQSETATAAIGTSIYVAGGFGGSRAVKRYDVDSNTWTVLQDLPGGRHHGMMAAHGGALWFAGGYGYEGGDQATRGWRYALSAPGWQAEQGLPGSIASGAATLNGYLWYGDITGDLTQFDPRTGRSRVVPAAPDGGVRDHSQVVAFQGEVWMLGGRADLVGETPLVSIYDPASETWRAGPRLSVPRAGFAAAASDRYVFAAGGEVIFSGPNRYVLGSAEVIGAGDDQWNALPALPSAQHGFGGAVIGSAFYAIGGSSLAGGASNQGRVQIYRFEP